MNYLYTLKGYLILMILSTTLSNEYNLHIPKTNNQGIFQSKLFSFVLPLSGNRIYLTPLHSQLNKHGGTQHSKSQDIRKLREITGVGMSICVGAYENSGGNLEVALKNLLDELSQKRKLSLSKELNATELLENPPLKQGQVGLLLEENTGLMLELRCKTSFVANSKAFLDFLQDILEGLMKLVNTMPNTPPLEIDEYLKCLQLDGLGLKEALLGAEQKFGETIMLSEKSLFSKYGSNPNTDPLHIGYYLHNCARDSIGKIGAMVMIKQAGQLTQPQDHHQPLLEEFSKKMAMHVAAANPLYNNIKDIESHIIKNKRKEILESLNQKGKSPEILERIIQGKLKKYYKEIILNEQEWYLDESKRCVRDIVNDYSTKLGRKLEILKFNKFSITD